MHTAVVDQFRDHLFGNLIPALEGRPKLAAYLDDLEVNEGDGDKLPDHAFAWPEKRAFPIHTAKHTAASRLYAEKTDRVPRAVLQKIAAACDVFEISEEMFTRPKVAAALENPSDYLLPHLFKLRVKTAKEVKVAEQRLVREYQKLTVENRAMACSRLVEKAAHFGVPLDPQVMKLAGYTITSTQALRRALDARTEAAKNTPSVKEAFEKLATAVRDLPDEIYNRDAQIKLAEAIHELDRKAGLERFYDRRLLDPMQSVFNTDKLAMGGVVLGGRMVPLDKLAAFPSQFYADVLGDDIVKEAASARGGLDPVKLAAIIDTLPGDMKAVLAAQMGPYLH